MKKPKKAALEVDYSNAKVGNQTLNDYLQTRGDDFVRDWPSDKAQAETAFMTQFNTKSKGLKLTADADVVYKMVIRVKYLDMGNSAGIFMPFATAKAGGCIMSGTVDIVDLQTKSIVCTLSIDKVKGKGIPSESIRLQNMFVQLAKSIVKAK
ncbi:MAG: hypothetical protein LBB53_05355 [Prevotellaceae bacterium]|nr:hypothetical protein [Prevotellaceae bacterium]